MKTLNHQESQGPGLGPLALSCQKFWVLLPAMKAKMLISVNYTCFHMTVTQWYGWLRKEGHDGRTNVDCIHNKTLAGNSKQTPATETPKSLRTTNGKNTAPSHCRSISDNENNFISRENMQYMQRNRDKDTVRSLVKNNTSGKKTKPSLKGLPESKPHPCRIQYPRKASFNKMKHEAFFWHWKVVRV